MYAGASGLKITTSADKGEEAGLTTDDRAAQPDDAELQSLRAEISDLKVQLAQAQTKTGTSAQGSPRARRRVGWRGPVSTLLIVLGCVLAPVSVLGVWTANQVGNTDRYVANMSPLIREPAVKAALTDKVSAAVSKQIDVQGYTKAAAAQLASHGFTRLGALLSNFSGSIASGVNGLIHSLVAKIIARPFVARLWVNGNRFAHTQLVKALSGHKSALSVSGDKVVIGLGPVIDQVKHGLAAHGLTIVNRLPPINPTFSLFSAKYLVHAQTLYRLLNTLKWVLPILAIVLLASGVYIARRHRRALVGAGLGLAASMLVLGLLLAVARSIFLSKIPGSVLPAPAAAVVFDTLIRFIKQGLRVIAVLGLVIAIAGFFTGPSVTAVRTREGFKSGFTWLRGTGENVGLTTGPVGTWVYRYRVALRAAAVALAGLVFVFWTDPTGLVVLGIAIVLLLVMGLIELIGRPPTGRLPVSSAGPAGSAGSPDSTVSPGSAVSPGSPLPAARTTASPTVVPAVPAPGRRLGSAAADTQIPPEVPASPESD